MQNSSRNLFVTILFGGYTYAGRSRETWSWNGEDWQSHTYDFKPHPTYGHVMVYHPGIASPYETGVFIFGGEHKRGLSDDICFLDDEGWHAWTLEDPTPGRRKWAAIAYLDGMAFMFGGKKKNGATLESWQLGGDRKWYRVPRIGPGARYCHAMATDKDRKVVVVFGGTWGNGISGAMQETWEWDGLNWKKANLAGPSRRFYHKMAYDEVSNKTVLFGGYTQTGYSDETWLWDGTRWRLYQFQLKERSNHAMAYDSHLKKIVVFGGKGDSTYEVFDDTWEWDGEIWSEKATSPSPTSTPVKRHSHAMAHDDSRHKTVLFGGYSEHQAQSLDDTWEWNGFFWSEKHPADSPSPRYGHAMAFDAARQQVILFGGIIGAKDTCSAETWVWDGSNWTLMNPANSPSARAYTAMAYDKSRNRIVLFGGRRYAAWLLNPQLSDTWEWDGANWTQVTLPTSPSGRYSHSMASLASGDGIVLFGGNTKPGPNDEVWEYDGFNWRQTSQTGPLARSGQAMAFHEATHKVVMLGGRDKLNPRNDTWLYTPPGWTPDLKVNSVVGRPDIIGVGELLRIIIRIRNRSNVKSFGGTIACYLSSDTKLDLDDTVLAFTWLPIIEAGERKTVRTSALIPDGTLAGNYYLIAKIIQMDTNPKNNIKAGSNPITIN